MVWKDKKAFAADMKQIYTAPTKQAAEAVLDLQGGELESQVILCSKKLA